MNFPVFCFRNLLLVFALGFTAALSAQQIHSCTIIPSAQPAAVASAPVYIPPGAKAAVSYKPGRTYDHKWTNGSTVTLRFLGGSNTLRQRVVKYAREWTQFANLNFKVVTSGRADIRIAFTQNGGSWSQVGNASSRSDQNRPSMNFGWLTDRTPDYEVRRTVLHEFGHALGLLHEHQNPEGGIPWDEDVVYDHYRRTQGWDERTTYNNVMATANRNTTQYSAYDHASIMHYPIDPRLTNGQYSVGMNKKLSPTDQVYIAKMYPGRWSPSTASTSVPKPTTTQRPTTTTSRPTTSRPTTTTTNRPSRPTTTNRPSRPVARKSYSVKISNELGRSATAETVQLYIGERRYDIRLNRGGRTRQQIALDLPPGKYRYRVVTSSTFGTYRNVRSPGGRVQRKYFEQQVPGSGEGVLAVSADADLTLFGQYDRVRGRMRVYLGARGK